MTLIHNNHIALPLLGLPEAGRDVHIRGNHFHLGLQADAAAQNLGAVPGVRAGLDEPNPQVIFLIVVLGDQGLSRFAGPHRAVFEIQFCHISTSVC
ncbi:hypothetical protein EVA_12036 [gut metagenome]|uniref:Uncharacterized protein n=1 Tax=gut metagenome TaxID=749906 RepID=J9CIG3_9ZZZZ